MRYHVGRLSRVALGTATLALIVAGSGGFTSLEARQEQEKGKRGRAKQVLPTGAEDEKPATAEEAEAEEALVRAVDRSHEALTVVEHADGSASVDTIGKFMTLSIATTNPDGTPGMLCLTGGNLREILERAAAANKARAAATKPTPKKMEEK